MAETTNIRFAIAIFPASMYDKGATSRNLKQVGGTLV